MLGSQRRPGLRGLGLPRDLRCVERGHWAWISRGARRAAPLPAARSCWGLAERLELRIRSEPRLQIPTQSPYPLCLCGGLELGKPPPAPKRVHGLALVIWVKEGLETLEEPFVKLRSRREEQLKRVLQEPGWGNQVDIRHWKLAVPSQGCFGSKGEGDPSQHLPVERD